MRTLEVSPAEVRTMAPERIVERSKDGFPVSRGRRSIRNVRASVRIPYVISWDGAESGGDRLSAEAARLFWTETGAQRFVRRVEREMMDDINVERTFRVDF